MLRPEHEALIHGAIDGTLTNEQREAYRVLMASSAEAQHRAAELEQLAGMIESLGPAEAPPDLAEAVRARLTVSLEAPPAAVQPVHQFIRRSVPKRGVAVNKKMIFALAAAAVVVLAVITYTSRPPASTGAEATIGAAQRAQTPQIAPADVKLADQSAQTLLQSETWDMIMKDEDLRTALQDAEIRRVLADADVRRALENQAVRRGLTDPELARQLKQRLSSNLSEAEARARGINWKKMNAALSNEAIARSLRTNRGFAESLLNPRVSKGLASDALPRVLADSNFEAALRNGARFEAALRSGKQAQ